MPCHWVSATASSMMASCLLIDRPSTHSTSHSEDGHASIVDYGSHNDVYEDVDTYLNSDGSFNTCEDTRSSPYLEPEVDMPVLPTNKGPVDITFPPLSAAAK